MIQLLTNQYQSSLLPGRERKMVENSFYKWEIRKWETKTNGRKLKHGRFLCDAHSIRWGLNVGVFNQKWEIYGSKIN